MYHLYNIFVELPSAPAAGAPFSQNDWPNPSRRRGVITDFVDGTEFWLFAQPVPFHQLDWPNPGLRRFSMRDFQNNAEVQLLGQDKFFGAPGMAPKYDYPNPVRRKFSMQDFVNPAEVQFLGKDTFFGAPGIGPSYDWTNPVRRKFSMQDFSNNAEVQFIGQDTFFGAPGMGPSYDWTNPVLRRRAAADQIGFVDGTEYWLFGVFPPFYQLDWQNPVRRRFSMQDFQNNAEVQFLGKDTFFGAPGMGPSYDWPNPGRNKWREVGWTDSLKLSYIFVPAPFAQEDWPNPVLRRFSMRDFQNNAGVQLLGQDQFFAAAGMAPSYDWPNPGRNRWREVGCSDSLKLSYVFVPVPFSMSDWPNPVRRRFSMQDFLNNAETQLLGQDQFFAAAGMGPSYDWPNPGRQRVRSEYGWADSYKLSLVPVFPFYQLDWQNPVRRRFSMQDFQNNAETQLFGQDQFFAAAGMGPTYDWTNPGRNKWREVGWTDSLKLSYTVIAPFFQVDWPNPGRRVRAEIGFTDPLKINLLVPFALDDWPNPMRSRRGSEYGMTNFYGVGVLGKDKFFGPPGMGPTYDWTNPVLRKGTVPRGYVPSFTFSLLHRIASSSIARRVIGQITQYLVVGQSDEHIIAASAIVPITGSVDMKPHDPLDFPCSTDWIMGGPLLNSDGTPVDVNSILDLSWHLDSDDSSQNFITLTMLGGGVV